MAMHPAIKLRHLRLFLKIADLGSLSAAGRAIGISQPAASKSLSELEELIGCRLFQRVGRRLLLTAEGEDVRRHARDAVASLDAAARVAVAGGERQRLSVGLLPTVSTRFFPAIAARFIAAEPDLTLAIETGSHPVLLRKLKERQIDLMIGRMPQAGELAGLEFEFLYEEPIIAALRADHPARQMDVREIIRRYPLILPTRDTIIRTTVDDYLGSIGLVGVAPAVETSTLALGRGLLLASDGLWFISQGVVQNELDAGQLVSIPLGATYLSGAVGMTRLDAGNLGRRDGEALARLMALTRQAAADRGRSAAG
ncbi:MAG: LysR substrate-binding domain-containing protein [Ancalomicrobiaceae bacterium]|nr:LysR substrate-binding domain-containing protein [Ancalomicrobiaceae bacterium]